MSELKEEAELFPTILRYFVIFGCIFIWIFLQTPLFRYDGMNLGLFRLYNDIVGNLLLAMAIVCIIKPPKKTFICAILLGLLSVGMDALLEIVINPFFGWYKPGGGAGTIVPTVTEGWYIPYEMLIGFFAMGIVVAIFTGFPRVFRTSWIKKVPLLNRIFSEGLFKNPKYDRLYVYLSSILLALLGAFGDHGTMALSANPPEYGPLLEFIAPWWTIWHTYLVWLISLNIGITFYFYVLDKVYKREFFIYPAPDAP
ncbi:MAG: hypothetical protein ACFFD2_30480 [Promethearchaeota archaeon]